MRPLVADGKICNLILRLIKGDGTAQSFCMSGNGNGDMFYGILTSANKLKS